MNSIRYPIITTLSFNKWVIGYSSNPTCWYPTTQNTNFVKWCLWINLGDASRMDNGVFTKGGSSNKVIYWLAIFGESCLTIMDHNSPVCVYSKEVTHVAFLWFTVSTLLAFTSEHRKNMVSWLEICNTFTYTLHNSIATQMELYFRIYWLCLKVV